MKADDFMDAMGKIDLKYVAEAEEMPRRKKSGKKYAVRIGISLAACATIFVIGRNYAQRSVGQNEMSSTAGEECAPEEAMLGSADEATEEEALTGKTFYFNQVKAEEVQALQDAENDQEQEAADTSYPTGGVEYAIVEAHADEFQNMQLPKDFIFLSQLAEGDTVIYSYGNTDGTESLQITIAKEFVSQYGNLLEREQYQKSEWNGEDVVVLQIDGEDHYLAQCQASGEVIEFEAENITEEEFEIAVKTFLEES